MSEVEILKRIVFLYEKSSTADSMLRKNNNSLSQDSLLALVDLISSNRFEISKLKEKLRETA